jgi:L-asparaginase
MKKVVIVHTGGTIAMSRDKGTGHISLVDEHPLESYISELSRYALPSVKSFFNKPSPHMTPYDMFVLSQEVNALLSQPNYDGLVMTHGTDTLEETAYFLDLLIDSDKPVIVTGAMRSSNEIGADGPHNLVQSVRVAIDSSAAGKGVLVVFNDEIHPAKNVTKTHTSYVHTFQSPHHGPIGYISKQRVVLHHQPIYREVYQINQVSKSVMLLKMFTGFEEKWLELLMKSSLHGLVIEAFGQGNIPPSLVPLIHKLIKKEVPVVLVSRCFNGFVKGDYHYVGGGKHLDELGVIFANGLNGPKARLKLLILLEAGMGLQQIRAAFN